MKDDGGPAFPVVFQHETVSVAAKSQEWGGMSLRDYFAIHCDQPGEAEIASAAGFVLSKGEVWESENKSLGTFRDWWKKLPNAERYPLYAKVRYQLADAMLAARTSSAGSEG